ncbi:MAG: penicillin-binding transpeptidase domain-containing protein [Desulfovibrionaceae bacterium]
MKAERERRKPSLGKAKLAFMGAVFALLWLALWTRAGYIQLVQGPHLQAMASRQSQVRELVVGQRGRILDRNGQLLATSVEAKSVALRPDDATEPERAATLLSEVLGLKRGEVGKLVRDHRKFVWVKRQITDREALAIREAAVPGVQLVSEYTRLYPKGHLAGQLLGFVGVDGAGLEGLERAFEKTLAGGTAEVVAQRDAAGRRLAMDPEGREYDVDGRDLTLTIDAHIQALAEQALAGVVGEYKAHFGLALVVDVPTGEVLALANCPFFNPNAYRTSTALQRRDRAALDILEPGSTMKPLLMASALQENALHPEEIVDCEMGRYRVGKGVISDHHPYGWLSVNQVLRYSSNIGAAKIGQALGANRYAGYLTRLGFGRATDAGVPSEASGVLRPVSEWSDFDLAACSFGQGVGVTALQMAQAYLTLADGGLKRPLRLVRGQDEPAPEERIFSPETTARVLAMMREVVEMDGTGRLARINGLAVAGKTGTAQKASKQGGYGDKYLSSFVGLLPADQPQLLVLVMVDEPEGVNAGGKVAAPVVREIAVNTLAYWGELPDAAKLADNAAPAAAAPETADAATPETADAALTLPGLDAPAPVKRAGDTVPNVSGLTLRRALEALAAKGIVPQVKGQGAQVVGQQPPAGQPWPEPGDPQQGEDHVFILWVS